MNKRYLGISIGIGAVLAVAAGAIAYARLSPLEDLRMWSVKITDRTGVLLQERHACDHGTVYPVALNEVPPRFIETLLATEDRRFYRHCGIDPAAVIRSAWLNVRHGRVVSGGSTITQQLARACGRHPRTLPYKLREALQAVCFEARYSKEAILEEYLNRIPFGNAAYGVEAAARQYFGKSIRDVTRAEAAFLCAIPASNKWYDPYRRFSAVRRRQCRILSALYLRQAISKDEYLAALNERVVLYARRTCFSAPHFCGMVAEKYRTTGSTELRTTLDANLQATVEYIVANHLQKLAAANVTNAAAIVLDNATGAVRALVGSADFYDELHQGQVNGATALRQPGSSIKPFVYGLAFDRGFRASDTLPDIKSSFAIPDGGVFMPKNYDKEYHGMVRSRTALACSYNVPTVHLAERFGADLLLAKLRSAGFSSLTRAADFYGPGLSLGCGEVTLVELARAYSALANAGILKEVRLLEAEPVRESGRLFSPEAAYLLTDILSDNNARAPAFGAFSPINLPFACAVKTGTSKNFRDNWTAGYTPRYTVAVWAGNFDGTAMHSVSGISGAGPLFRDIMLALEVRNPASQFVMPAGIARRRVCAVSGALPGNCCAETVSELFINGTLPREHCSMHQQCRIDTRNNLLAAGDCPPEYREDRVYTVYPSEYYAWAVAAGVEMPPGAISLLPGTGRHCDTGDNCLVELPRDGDQYKIDPILRREYQRIQLKPHVAADRIRSIVWRVDGHELPAQAYPFDAYWQLEPGRHRIGFVAQTDTGALISNNVHITVYP